MLESMKKLAGHPLILLALISLTLLISACGAPTNTDGATLSLEQSQNRSAPPDSPATSSQIDTSRSIDDENYPPVNFLLHFDSILPIYEPEFVAMEDSPLRDEELVIAVSIDGESKAYPITVLRFREMVNDEIAGTPILVSW